MNYCPLRFFDLKINNNIDKKSHWPTIDFALFLGSCKNKNEESNTDSFFIRKSESVYSCGSFHNVILADRELKELKHRFPYDWQNWIERLSSYMASTGKKYRNHYAMICSWAVKEQKNIPGKNYDLPEGKGF